MRITPELVEEHGLSPQEYQKILEILGREPTLTELGIFSVMWSEHCSYKNSKPLLKTFPTSGPHILQGPGENAGVVDFDERFAIAFKIESHNHPSAIEPYQGAATGVGGILRDIFTMGARPIALLDPLRFGDPNNSRTRHLIAGVVAGIADYGNSVGVPTVGGECYFAPCYDGNPLVNVMCVGLVEKEKIVRAVAHGSGNLVFYYGNATGRDGIHGATFASTELTEESEEKRGAVQVGDPFMEKKILEATLELIARGAVLALQDMGAAGLTCSTAEMAGRGGMGVCIDLDKVPQRAEHMSAYEIMLSESQERMLGVCTPEQLPLVERILAKWDLKPHVLGQLDDSGIMRVIHKGEVVAQIPAAKISEDSPVYCRHGRRPAYLELLPDSRTVELPPLDALEELILVFLSSPNVCSKRWIFEQYDYMVQTQTLTGPGNNAAVLKVHDSETALAVSTDGNSLFCYVDPYEGGKHAVAEAARNVACAGAEPLAITNCLNFGSPLKEEIFYQLAEAVRGIGDACRALGTPVTGGNVSLYNETPENAIWPTPIIGMVGRITPPAHPMKGHFASPGRIVVLVGPRCDHLGASEFLRWQTGLAWGPCPPCDLQLEKRVIEFLVELARQVVAASAHDCSVGGLITTLTEALLWSDDDNLGLDVSLNVPGRMELFAELFGEFAPRVIVSVAHEDFGKLQKLAEQHGLPVRALGTTTDRGVVAISCPFARLTLPTSSLRAAYESTRSIFTDQSDQIAMH
ncbi:MAG: phosphoribosylformylglycinamidine synthase subunit PurL [Candidatus Sumerlaeaceae bacterium]|jgi:phosphoribosylformylglycinamidine synthase